MNGATSQPQASTARQPDADTIKMFVGQVSFSLSIIVSLMIGFIVFSFS